MAVNFCLPFLDQNISQIIDFEMSFECKFMPSNSNISGFCISDYDAVKNSFETFKSRLYSQRIFEKPVVFENVPAVVSSLNVRKNLICSADKPILTGASGTRAINRYFWECGLPRDQAETELIEFFERMRSQKASREAVSLAGEQICNLPVVLVLRNTFNYYHFLTETLGHFSVLSKLYSSGHLSGNPIYLCFPNKEEKIRNFVIDFIKDLYPELAKFVVFRRAPFEAEQAVTIVDTKFLYYVNGLKKCEEITNLLDESETWQGMRGAIRDHDILNMNSAESSLLGLRDDALALVPSSTPKFPKRFWFGRRAGLARDRTMGGEQELLDHLEDLGFSYVCFEDHTPLEQISLMANAEIAISYHGAGFANLLFANSKATVIELGTLQTAKFRWGDFWKHAVCSGVNYLSLFADHKTQTPEIEPAFRDDGIVPVSLGEAGMSFVINLVSLLVQEDVVVNDEEQLLNLCLALASVRHFEKSIKLAEKNAEMILNKANFHKYLGNLLADLGAKDLGKSCLWTSFLEDQQQLSMLRRLIWLSVRTEDWQSAELALKYYNSLSQNDLSAFLEKRPALTKLLKKSGRLDSIQNYSAKSGAIAS